jgi:Protein of unknown function (DUF1153)
MIENQKIRPAQVIGPLGESLTVDSLPPPSTTRWVLTRSVTVTALPLRNLLAGSVRLIAQGCLAFASLVFSNISRSMRGSSGFKTRALGG